MRLLTYTRQQARLMRGVAATPSAELEISEVQEEEEESNGVTIVKMIKTGI